MTAYFVPYMYLRIAHWWKLVLLTIPSENLRIYSLFCNLWLASLIQRNERYERPVKLCIQVSSCTIDWYDPFCIGIFSLHSLGLQVKENCLVYKEIQHVGPNNINVLCLLRFFEFCVLLVCVLRMCIDVYICVFVVCIFRTLRFSKFVLKVEYLAKLFTEVEVVSEGHLPLANPTLVICFFFFSIYLYIYIYLNSDII